MFGKEKSQGAKASTPKQQTVKPAKENSKKERSMKAFNGNGNESTTTLIAKGTEIVGDVKFKGNLEIEGKVCGSISAIAGGDAMVRILEHGEVEGDIEVPVVIINGRVHGDVHSGAHIELANKAKVDGNVHYNLIEMVKGAQINGSLLYSGTEKGKSAGRTAIGKSDDAESPSASH